MSDSIISFGGVGGVAHRDHARGLLARDAFEHRCVDVHLDVAWQEFGEHGFAVRLVDVVDGLRLRLCGGSIGRSCVTRGSCIMVLTKNGVDEEYLIDAPGR